MSWASENPEQYSEICNQAIARKLLALHPNSDANNLHDDLYFILEELELTKEARAVYDALLSWANKEIGDGYADHFSE